MDNDVLNRAFLAHQAGDILTASQGYEAVLQSHPGHPIAFALQALTRHQMVISRMSMGSALTNLKNQGFLPATVFDVGAQIGTPPLFEVFPDAHHVLLEPVAECEPLLKDLCSRLKSAEYHIAAVTEHSGKTFLGISPSRQYSSIVEAPGVDGSEYREIPCLSLSDLCKTHAYPGPYLVKIDVDGPEIKVLKGALGLIDRETVFVIEATVNDGDPHFPQILDFFKPLDFVLLDIVDPMFRPVDGALWQVDVVMVHAESRYRRIKVFVN